MRPYYSDESVTLYHGDCLLVLQELGDQTIEAFITDPPYFMPAVHYNTRREWPRSLSDVSILEHFYRDLFEQAGRVLRCDGMAYVFCDGQSYPVFYATAYPFFRKLRPLVWDKCVAFNGYSWRHQHELILFAEKDDAPSVTTGDGDILRCRAVAIDEREHPAQKPMELLGKLIRKSTQSGAVVLDPFSGSGATLLAAIRYGRKAIGIERDEAYCELVARRLSGGVMGEKLPLEYFGVTILDDEVAG